MLCRFFIIDDEVIEKVVNAGYPDLKDNIQYFSILANGCDTIITCNAKDYKKASIKVMDAEKFLRFFEGRISQTHKMLV